MVTKSIFTDDLPLVTSGEQLEALKNQYPDYDPYYIASGAIADRRDKFVALYQRFAPYADRHFLSEVRRHFHQRTWEMYLGCVLLDRNIHFTSEDKGPDFLVQGNGHRFWIECVACEKGQGADKVPDLLQGFHSVPMDEMLIRMASALKGKFERYKQYLNSGLVKETDPFVIALSIGALEHIGWVVPLLLRCVFALGHPTLSIPLDGNGSPKNSGFSTIEYIEKKNGSPVPMTFFLEEEHTGISAIMFCDNNVLNHPNDLGVDIVTIHNPHASNSLIGSILDTFKTYQIDEHGDIHL